MGPRKDVGRDRKAADARKDGQKSKLRVVKLEPRIAPKLAANHSETLVRDRA